MVDTYLKVYEPDGHVQVLPEDEPRINAAVGDWIDSGDTRDRLLDLTLIDGGAYYTKASRIMSWVLSTPETRRRGWEIQKAMKDEDEAYKQAVGIFDGD